GAKAPEAPKSEPAKIASAPATPPPAVTAPPAAETPAPTVAPSPPPPQAATPETGSTETKAPETKAPEATAPEAKAPEAKAPETKVAAAPKPAAKAPAAQETSFLNQLYDDTPTWALGAGAAGIVALIAGLFAARRRKTTKFEDSIISGTDIKTNTVFGSTGGGVVNTGDNSLASDFSREGLGSIDTDEVDPIAEAEVYLAYGRDAQAEEILKEALKKDPQRQEIYLKLLEIHAQHNKPSAFETVASELYSVSGGQGEVWQKAMALGRQLDPNNPLFAEAGGAAAFAAAAAAEGEHREATGEATTPAPAARAPAAPFVVEPALEARAAKGIDFTLDDDISLSPTSEVAPKTPAAILAGAAREVAKSTRADSGSLRPVAPVAKSADAKPAPVHDSVAFEPESVPKFDL